MSARTQLLPDASAKAATSSRRHLKPRQRIAAGVAATLMFTGVGVAAAGTASAAGPDNVYPGQSVQYPTWAFWGWTKLCATNFSYSGGSLTVVPQFPGASSERMYARPRATTCINRQWGGVTIKVINTGSVLLQTSTQ